MHKIQRMVAARAAESQKIMPFFNIDCLPESNTPCYICVYDLPFSLSTVDLLKRSEMFNLCNPN